MIPVQRWIKMTNKSLARQELMSFELDNLLVSARIFLKTCRAEEENSTRS